jgi:hypothetical protein
MTAVTLALMIVIGTEIALAATGASTSHGVTPSELLRRSLGAAESAGSFHYDATWQTNGLVQSIVGDARLSSGTQSVSVGGGHFISVLTGTVVYVQGDDTALRHQLGLLSATATATARARKWISIRQSDGPYPSMESGLTTESVLAQVVIRPSATASITPRHRPRLVRISGSIPSGSHDQVITGSARLDVAARSDLPSAYSARGRNGGQPWSVSIIYTRWGEHVQLPSPRDPLPYASLNSTAISPP